jgi:hypothetical protein
MKLTNIGTIKSYYLPDENETHKEQDNEINKIETTNSFSYADKTDDENSRIKKHSKLIKYGK